MYTVKHYFVRAIAKEMNISYQTAMLLTTMREKGFKNSTEYQEHLAQQKGFKNLTEYDKHLAQERSTRKVNRKLSNLVQTKLKEMGRNQSWLAIELGVDRQMVSRYIHGRSVPIPETAQRLFSVLGLPYKNLEDLIDNQ